VLEGSCRVPDRHLEEDDWAVRAFWVDNETDIGSCRELDRVEEMFSRRHIGRGEALLDSGI